MPKYLTHWVLAEAAAGSLSPERGLGSRIRRFPHLFMAGAAIPDTPFFMVAGPGSARMQDKAERLHENTNFLQRWDPGSALGKGPDMRDAALALLAGILCHIQADSVFHPPVYFFSGTVTSLSEARHHRLEAFFDLYFSRNLELPAKKRFFEVLQGIEIEPGRFLSSLTLLFGLQRPGDRARMRQALYMNALFQGMFLSPPLRRIAGLCYPKSAPTLRAHLAHFYPRPLPDLAALFPRPLEYRDPVTGERMQKSVDWMARETVDRTLELFSRWEAEGFRTQGLIPPGWNLYTGRTGAGKGDMTFFDTRQPVEKLVGL